MKAARLALFIAATVGLVGCDHATKLAAHGWLEGRPPVTIVGGFLDLRYTENRDIAFSLTRHLDLPAKPFILGGVALLTLVGIAAWWWRRRAQTSRLEDAGVAMLLAGAAGNLVDRLARGYVIDFIYLHGWPVFNVADVLVVAGVLALLLGRRGALSRAAPQRR